MVFAGSCSSHVPIYCRPSVWTRCACARTVAMSAEVFACAIYQWSRRRSLTSRSLSLTMGERIRVAYLEDDVNILSGGFQVLVRESPQGEPLKGDVVLQNLALMIRTAG